MANFRLFQTEDFADNYFNFDENGRKFSEQLENTVGKGEIARSEQFFLFLQYFQKPRTVENQGLFGKGLSRFRVYTLPDQSIIFMTLREKNAS